MEPGPRSGCRDCSRTRSQGDAEGADRGRGVPGNANKCRSMWLSTRLGSGDSGPPKKLAKEKGGAEASMKKFGNKTRFVPGQSEATEGRRNRGHAECRLHQRLGGDCQSRADFSTPVTQRAYGSLPDDGPDG